MDCNRQSKQPTRCLPREILDRKERIFCLGRLLSRNPDPTSDTPTVNDSLITLLFIRQFRSESYKARTDRLFLNQWVFSGMVAVAYKAELNKPNVEICSCRLLKCCWPRKEPYRYTKRTAKSTACSYVLYVLGAGYMQLGSTHRAHWVQVC